MFQKVGLVLLEVKLPATILNSLAVWVLLLPTASRTADEERLLNVDVTLLMD